VSHSNTISEAAVEEFATYLRREHRNHGEPSLRVMAARMNDPRAYYRCRSSPSTLHRSFQGHRLPAWTLVQALLGDALGVPHDTIQAAWLPRWIAVRDLEEPIHLPADGVLPVDVPRPPQKRELRSA
jgi:hypothetical protein